MLTKYSFGSHSTKNSKLSYVILALLIRFEIRVVFKTITCHYRVGGNVRITVKFGHFYLFLLHSVEASFMFLALLPFLVLLIVVLVS
jgi:hypothetical protein